MLDVFRGLKSLLKVNAVNIDSPVFRLHYSITVMILMAFSLIVTTRQYVGGYSSSHCVDMYIDKVRLPPAD